MYTTIPGGGVTWNRFEKLWNNNNNKNDLKKNYLEVNSQKNGAALFAVTNVKNNKHKTIGIYNFGMVDLAIAFFKIKACNTKLLIYGKCFPSAILLEDRVVRLGGWITLQALWMQWIYSKYTRLDWRHLQFKNGGFYVF